MNFPDFDNFASLKQHLAELPDQTEGHQSSICETGEQYVEFYEVGLARPADVAIIERIVARRMSGRLREYLVRREGRIYWRIPFEGLTEEYSEVARYDENGPDLDVITDRKCFKDKNWRRVACYCRLYRATHKVDFAAQKLKTAA